MKIKVLNIVETAYRATLEEQDDTVIWFLRTIQGAGAGIDVLLVGNAVSYLDRAQDASGLSFGGERQTQPPRIAADLEQLMAAGGTVFAAREDAAERGLARERCIEGVEWLDRAAVAPLLDRYDRIWYW
ncbi:MAG TPA: DsrE family protein [Gammaproteobacteria bacterium]